MLVRWQRAKEEKATVSSVANLAILQQIVGRKEKVKAVKVKVKEREKEKEKGKGDGGKDGGKAKGKGKGAGGGKKFQGYCNKCNKWGHKGADCRSAPGANSLDQGDQQAQQPEPEAASGNNLSGLSLCMLGHADSSSSPSGIAGSTAARPDEWKCDCCDKVVAKRCNGFRKICPKMLCIDCISDGDNPFFNYCSECQRENDQVFEFLERTHGFDGDSSHSTDSEEFGPDVPRAVIPPPRTASRAPLPQPEEEDIASFESSAIRVKELQALQQLINSLPKVRPRSDQMYEDVYTIDSGAAVSALPVNRYPCYRVMDSSSKGRKYRAANGDTIEDRGSKTPIVQTPDGAVKGMTFSVCDVHKPLVSVAKILDAGNRVIFDPQGCYIENISSKERTTFYRKNNVFEMPVKVFPRNMMGKSQGELAAVDDDKVYKTPGGESTFQRQEIRYP